MRVASEWVACPTSGGDVTVPTSSGLTGLLRCPPYDELCGSLDQGCPDSCSGRGVCQSDGTCSCSPGYHGAACEFVYCPMASPGDNAAAQECSGDDAGECDETTGQCQCKPGRAGVACEEGVCDDDGTGSECSGHGSCTTAGECECDTGYGGVTCSALLCASNCTVAGRDEEGNALGACDLSGGVCICRVMEGTGADARLYGGVDCSDLEGTVRHNSVDESDAMCTHPPQYMRVCVCV